MTAFKNKSIFNSGGDEDFFHDFYEKNDIVSAQPVMSIETLFYLESKSKESHSLTNFPNVKSASQVQYIAVFIGTNRKRLFSTG